MVGLKKKITYAKISPKMVNPRDIARERKKKKKKKEKKTKKKKRRRHSHRISSGFFFRWLLGTTALFR